MKRIILVVIFFIVLSGCSSPNQDETWSLGEPTATSSETDIQIDGLAADWNHYPLISEDPAGDHRDNSTDLGDLKAFINDRYFYFLLNIREYGPVDRYQVDVILEDETIVRLTFFQGAPDAQIKNPLASPPQQLEAQIAWDQALEVKIPLEVFGQPIVRIEAVEAFVNALDTSDMVSGGSPFIANEFDTSELGQSQGLEGPLYQAFATIQPNIDIGLSQPPHHVNSFNTTQAPFYLVRCENQTPHQMDFGPDGNLYIADWSGGRVVILSTEGEYLGDAGLWRKNLWPGDGPRSLVFDSTGTMYVASSSLLFSVSLDQVITQMLHVDGQIIGGITVNDQDQLFFTDRRRGQVLKLLPDGQIELVAEGIHEAEALVFGLDGSLYVSQRFQQHIVKVDVNTGMVEDFIDTLAQPDPIYLFIDQDGDLWIREIGFLSQFSPEGERLPVQILYPDGTQLPLSELSTSAGIVFDSMGRIWTGSYDSSIQRLDPVEGEDDVYIYHMVQPNMEAYAMDQLASGELVVYNANAQELIAIDASGVTRTLFRSAYPGHGAVAVNEDDTIFLGLPSGEIIKLNPDGSTTHWAFVLTRDLALTPDGDLLAVDIDPERNKSIILITGQDQISEIVPSSAWEEIGVAPDGEINLTAYREGQYILFEESSGSLLLMDESGQLSFLTDAPQFATGQDTSAWPTAPTPITVGPDGTLYILPGLVYSLWAIPENASWRTLAGPIWGDPTALYVPPDGSVIYVAESGSISIFPLD